MPLLLSFTLLMLLLLMLTSRLVSVAILTRASLYILQLIIVLVSYYNMVKHTAKDTNLQPTVASCDPGKSDGGSNRPTVKSAFLGLVRAEIKNNRGHIRLDDKYFCRWCPASRNTKKIIIYLRTDTSAWG